MSFKKTMIEFQKYWSKNKKSKIFDGNVAIEISRSLHWMEMIINKVRRLEKYKNPNRIKEYKKVSEMEFFVYSYYYIADRTKSVIKLLPGLNNFEASGVRSVRNQLIVHPERNDSRITNISFGWKTEGGPKIKPVRHPGQEKVWLDNGLYKNNEEFLVIFYSLLSKINLSEQED